MRRRIRLGGYPPPLVVYGGLALGVSAVSSAAVIIRLADAPSLTIAAYRLVLASIIVVPLGMALEWGALRSLTRRQWGLVFAAAVCLAAHFAFWITSLEHTSVASSVVIVTSNPVLVAIGAAVLLRERTSARALAGVGLAIAGGVVIALGDWDLGDRRLYGDLAGAGGRGGGGGLLHRRAEPARAAEHPGVHRAGVRHGGRPAVGGGAGDGLAADGASTARCTAGLCCWRCCRRWWGTRR